MGDAESGTSGYPEEHPPDHDPGEGGTDQPSADDEPIVRESDREDEPGSREGSSGEGTQSTGHPGNAG
jgi:hypothetical protein